MRARAVDADNNHLCRRHLRGECTRPFCSESHREAKVGRSSPRPRAPQAPSPKPEAEAELLLLLLLLRHGLEQLHRAISAVKRQEHRSVLTHLLLYPLSSSVTLCDG